MLIIIYESQSARMELFLEYSSSEAFLLGFIAAYLKLEDRNCIKIIYLSEGALKAKEQGKFKLEVPTLITLDGELITETFAISRHLLSMQPAWKTTFLGVDEQQKNEINNIKIHLKEYKELRKHLQKHLETRTFFVSNHITFADIFMFTQLYDNVVQMTNQQKSQYNHIFRWYRHIQNLPEVKDFLLKKGMLMAEMPQPKLSILTAPKGKKIKKN